MILPFPTKAEDWYTIWSQTKTLTIATVSGEFICTPIHNITINTLDKKGSIESVRITIGGGNLLVAFSETFSNIEDEVVYTLLDRKPTQGSWHIPEHILRALNENNEQD